MVTQAVILMVFPAVMAFAACSDLLTMTISNKVSLVLLAAFFVLAFALGLSPAVIASHLGASAVMLALTFGLFAAGWIGGGDAKFAAATALWLGWTHLFDYLLIASIFGGVLTLLLLQFRRMPLPETVSRHVWVDRLHRADNGVPYGIALAAAALVVYPQTLWMKALGG